MTQNALFQSLHFTGVAVYGLSILFFVILLWRSGSEAERLQRHRRFLSWGPVLGLSMGALIFGGLGLYYLEQGGFKWGLADRDEQLTAITHGLFLVLWVSHFHLEIWTQEPLRKLDGENGPSDMSAWEAACTRVSRQLRFNLLLFLAIAWLSVQI
jgi:hypothetical protein